MRKDLKLKFMSFLTYKKTKHVLARIRICTCTCTYAFSLPNYFDEQIDILLSDRKGYIYCSNEINRNFKTRFAIFSPISL